MSAIEGYVAYIWDQVEHDDRRMAAKESLINQLHQLAQRGSVYGTRLGHSDELCINDYFDAYESQCTDKMSRPEFKRLLDYILSHE